MVKEKLDTVYPNLFEPEPRVEITGNISDEAVERLRIVVSSEIDAAHQHYSKFDIKPVQQLPPTTLQVELYDDQNYRQFQSVQILGDITTFWEHRTDMAF